MDNGFPTWERWIHNGWVYHMCLCHGDHGQMIRLNGPNEHRRLNMQVVWKAFLEWILMNFGSMLIQKSWLATPEHRIFPIPSMYGIVYLYNYIYQFNFGLIFMVNEGHTYIDDMGFSKKESCWCFVDFKMDIVGCFRQTWWFLEKIQAWVHPRSLT